MAKAVFYDPAKRRWRYFRRVLDALGIAFTLLIGFFLLTAFRSTELPGLLLPQPRPRFHALKESERRHSLRHKVQHRRTQQPASQVVLNAEEGIRAAFYVTWDAGSFASLREHVHQIDLLYPEWLHVLTSDGRLQAVSADNRLYDVFDSRESARAIDDKLMPFLKEEKAETEVFPLVNNFDPIRNVWSEEIGRVLSDPAARAAFRRQILAFLGSGEYAGLTLDFETIPAADQPGFKALLSELSGDLHGRNLKLYVAVPPHNPEFDYAYIGTRVDGLILMNYDQHYPGGAEGPVAGQDWFTGNLESALHVVPREKLICAIGNYGYDWSTRMGKRRKPEAAEVRGVTNQEAWLGAHDSEAEIAFDPESLNPHYSYIEGDSIRHDVWFLDAVSALNQMRAADRLGIRTFALWRLGSEDPSLWAIWDAPDDPGSADRLGRMPPGQDVDREGAGEILRIDHRPAYGSRQVVLDAASGLITSESLQSLPTPYKILQYGGAEKMVALTFDDGPDPAYTARILDILRAERVRATFFVIGLEAEKHPALLQRMYREGHEIGNHTFTHPDISNVSRKYMEVVELNLTERLFAAKLGVKPLFFRPPYSIDQEPDTADEVRPLELVQDEGYFTVGAKNDPNDWRPQATAPQIVAEVLDPLHLPPCREGAPDYLRCGNIVLLHDGGGNRQATVEALPLIIRGLRQRGYQIVATSELLGKTAADVMPPISPNERWAARVDNLGFFLFAMLGASLFWVFLVGDVLMTARLLFVGALAIFDRLYQPTRREPAAGREELPRVAVLVPAYNEERVIERTVRAVLASDYPNLRVLVVDDGSSDRTLEVVQTAFSSEITAGKVLALGKRNAGKAEALNHALQYVTEEVFVGLDADTVIAPDAIRRLVNHFGDSRVAAVAGNAKVGNRVNLWTRWQALEYITSQNFERRALNTLGAVCVVPGAIGAWRVSAVRQAGGYQPDTVAEDADLTMSLLELGLRVVYEDRALAFTEAPCTANGLMRQRFRWSFGILQSAWKHRRAFLRRGTLGWVALPNILVFQIVLPLVSPFIDLMFAFGALMYAYNRHFHPEAADPASFLRLVVYFAAFLVIDFVASAIAFALERRGPGYKEEALLLVHIWLQRFVYRQLFSVVLFKTLKRAIDGRPFSWDKLERTAALSQANP